jgi:hypothetical protein
LRLIKDIFRAVEAFDHKCEALIKFTRLFEAIFREMGALIRNLRLFKDEVSMAFCGTLMWDILKYFEAFKIHFERSGGSCLEM